MLGMLWVFSMGVSCQGAVLGLVTVAKHLPSHAVKLLAALPGLLAVL